MRDNDSQIADLIERVNTGDVSSLNDFKRLLAPLLKEGDIVKPFADLKTGILFGVNPSVSSEEIYEYVASTSCQLSIGQTTNQAILSDLSKFSPSDSFVDESHEGSWNLGRILSSFFCCCRHPADHDSGLDEKLIGGNNVSIAY
jgi:hypothetical protein